MVVQVSDVWKSFPSAEGPVPVLSGASLTLDAGQSLALTGESGSGKSTLLHLIGALDTVDAGEIALAGTRLSGLGDTARAGLRRKTVGLVFQQFNLIPSLDVAANLAFQARLAGCHDPHWCAELAAAMGLLPLLQRMPDQLSGGQQQRVAIGRALAVRPALILADEPTGNLDAATGDTVLGLMLDLVGRAGSALLMVTHSDRLAARLDRHARLLGGRLAQGDGVRT